jgi:hypothetical protein
MSHDEISDFFGIDPYESEGVLVPTKSKEKAGSTDDLYQAAVKNVKALAELGESTLVDLAALAAQTEDPKAYEVFGKLLKEVIAANERIIHLKGTKLDVEEKEGVDGKPKIKTTTNNNLFIGSTAELIKKLDATDV